MSVLWTSAEIEAATSGRVTLSFSVNGLSIDSRDLTPGDLFVALQDTRDGHEFVATALTKGAAAENADLVIVTDDNPRSENAATIRAAVLAGCRDAIEVGDRAEAILRGVDALEPGDALLIAGKGHETGQIVGSTVYPFDDGEQASIAVAALDGRI